MHEIEENKLNSESNVLEKDSIKRPILDEKVTAQMLQIFGNQTSQYMPTQSQVDKILSLQEKELDYKYKENVGFTSQQKIDCGFFLTIIIVFVGIFMFSIYKVPQYTGEIIAGLIGFLAGGGGGYGLAKANKARKNCE